MKKKNERHIAILLAVMMIFMNFIIAPVMADGDVAINETNFPDENFRNYVKTSTKINTNGDDVLSKAELDAVTVINVLREEITNLKGIEHFTKLKKLYCHENKLTTLDLSHNTELTEIYCNKNQLTALDLSHNTELTYINCSENQLSALDLSNNAKLTFIDCADNQLTTLDLTNKTNLKTLYCFRNQLKTLNLKNNTNLKTFYCRRNQLTNLDLKSNTNLEDFSCSYNELTNLDLSHNTNLKELSCDHNQLAALDLKNNTAVTNFDGSNQEPFVSVQESSTSLNLTKLATGFDPSKMSDVVGGTKSDNTLTLIDNTNEVTYTYEASTGKKLGVTLHIIYGEAVKVTCDRNKGTGYMKPLSLKAGSPYELPYCYFTPPAGKEFKAWEVNGEEKQRNDSITVNSNIIEKLFGQIL